MNREQYIKLEEFFKTYVRSILPKSISSCVKTNIQLKYKHTQNVCRIVQHLALEMNINKPVTFLACSAALLHDIGRFSQIAKYRTYDDEVSEDHAKTGVGLLEANGVLSALDPIESNFILTAIRIHNIATIPDNFTGDMLLIAQLLRDADKLDIFRVSIDYYKRWAAGRDVSDIYTNLSFEPYCSSQVIECMFKKEPIPFCILQTVYDEILLCLSWISNLSFKCSVQYLDRKKHIDYMLSVLIESDQQADIVRFIQAVKKERLR